MIKPLDATRPYDNFDGKDTMYALIRETRSAVNELIAVANGGMTVTTATVVCEPSPTGVSGASEPLVLSVLGSGKVSPVIETIVASKAKKIRKEIIEDEIG